LNADLIDQADASGYFLFDSARLFLTSLSDSSDPPFPLYPRSKNRHD